MDHHGVTNKGSLRVLHLQSHRFQGVQLDYFHIQNTVLCGIGQIIFGRGVTGRAYLGVFLVVVEHITKFSGYSWCQIRSDLTQNDI